MNALINQLRQHMSNLLAAISLPVKGIVDSVDPNTMTCVVRYQPEDEKNPANSLSPSLPISCIAVGNGFGIIAVPNVGDQVFINYERGTAQVGVVQGAIFDSSVDVPPQGMNPGEYWMVHETGSHFKFTDDGKVSLNGQVEIDVTTPVINITTTGNASISVGGNLTATAVNASVTGTTSASVTSPSITLGNGGTTNTLAIFNQLKSYIDNHTHSGVQAGSGNTGAPTAPLSAAAATTIVKGQ